MLEEAYAAVDHSACLGLRDVVQERRQLEDLAAADVTAELLGHVGRELLAERPEPAQTQEERIGPGARPERGLENRKWERRRLRRRAITFHLRHDLATQAA